MIEEIADNNEQVFECRSRTIWERELIAEERFLVGQSLLDVSISCGLSSTKFSSEFSGLLKAADVSLYEAKEQGRNCTRPQVLKAS